MPRAVEAQLNIRSRFARDRATQIARETGMTATQVVEEALRAYAPPREEPAPAGMKRRGKLLILTGGPRVTSDDVIAAIQADRDERG